MQKRMITGNEALALGALRAGVKVVTGYPGTPSTGALTSLLGKKLDGRHVEWSTNEKVALEIATGAAWAGQRALCTMKMSGLNVAFDSLASIAYSGCTGGLVIYVADDPGVNAGMVEQDTRGFALMSDLPMLEPATVADTYQMVQHAFEISEETGTPVFVRLSTATADSYGLVEVEEAGPVPEREALLVRDISRYTKAGAAICKAQHRDVIAKLEKSAAIIARLGINRLALAGATGGLGILAAGVTASYLEEGFEIAERLWGADSPAGFDREAISVLSVAGVNPFPAAEVRALLGYCDTILVLEELEPHLENRVYIEAQRLNYSGKIIGKLDGTFSRIGEYGASHVVQGMAVALGRDLPAGVLEGRSEAEQLATARPITVCAGCPHRGTYMAINQAMKKLRLKPDEVMVTGDIGCTILGMNPPFHTVWNEISMGASVALAQGFAYAGVQTPVIATMGDSTFFHAGIPGLINAVQHQVPLTLIIMDNGWTAMTGMQVNPGTNESFQGQGNRSIDIANIIPALGVDQFFIMDPFDFPGSTETVRNALTLPGVKVILSRQACAIQSRRQGHRAGPVPAVTDDCNLCKLCISITGCLAITIGETKVVIDPAQCYGCNLCAAVCNRHAIVQD